MVGYFQVFFVDTLCSGLGTFFICHKGPKQRLAATPNQTLLDEGLRAKVWAGGEAGATLAPGWRRLTQCPIGQNLNQRAPTWRVFRGLRRNPFSIVFFFKYPQCGASGVVHRAGQRVALMQLPRRSGAAPPADKIQNKTKFGRASAGGSRSSSSTSRSRTL